MPTKKAKKMDSKLLAYYTRPHEVEYQANKHKLPIQDYRDIVFSVNQNGKPCRSIPRIDKAVEVYKKNQENVIKGNTFVNNTFEVK